MTHNLDTNLEPSSVNVPDGVEFQACTSRRISLLQSCAHVLIHAVVHSLSDIEDAPAVVWAGVTEGVHIEPQLLRDAGEECKGRGAHRGFAGLSGELALRWVHLPF